MASANNLIAIIELGGYPNFTPLYKRLGFEPNWSAPSARPRPR
jgi:hypothetical protein